MKKALFLTVLLFAVALYAEDFATSDAIQFKLKSVSLEKNGSEKADRIFMPGQTVWINLQVMGLEKDANKDVGFQADLLMTGKGGRVVLDKKNILNQTLHAGDIIPVITATFNIDLYDNIKAEKYLVTIIFRDMVAKKFNKWDTWFKVAR